MIYYLFFILELVILFTLSKSLTRSLGQFIFRVTRNKETAVYVMAILFLPGTFVHEISHFLAALFLLVPVRQMELMPEIDGDRVKMGSVPVAKVDFVRNFLVGVAPLILGTSIIIGGLFYVISNGLLGNTLYAALTFYLIFEIGNTMFLSKRDLEGSFIFFVFILFIILTFYVLGIRLNFSEDSFLVSENTLFYVKQAAIFLSFPILFDIALLGIIGLVLNKLKTYNERLS